MTISGIVAVILALQNARIDRHQTVNIVMREVLTHLSDIFPKKNCMRKDLKNGQQTCHDECDGHANPRITQSSFLRNKVPSD